MKIALTGGGTAGHVNPNIALLPALNGEGFEVIYIGSFEGIERKLLKNYDVKYFPIPTGKLRRYFDLKNFTDMFRTISGVSEAAKILKREKVDIVFSKGGFVGVPVVLGAKRHGIPVVIHESDYTPGLANKIAIPFAKKVCVTFPETMARIGKKKAVLTGNPIRSFLFEGRKDAGISFCGFKSDKPVLLVMGGSLGSKKINDCVRSIQKTLNDTYNVAHICGKGNLVEELKGIDGYRQFEYIDKELNDVLAAADVVISRAGANAVAEFLALKKPNLLIPLSKKASRGDQILNAASFQKNGYSMVLEEEEMSEFTLLKSIDKLYDDRAAFIKNMEKSTQKDAARAIIEVVLAAGK